MFGFITKVMKGTSSESLMSEVESLRREMLADRSTVIVRDLGAGSARFHGAGRRISDIAATAALGKKETGLLARIAMAAEEPEGNRQRRDQSFEPGRRSMEEAARGTIAGEPHKISVEESGKTDTERRLKGVVPETSSVSRKPVEELRADDPGIILELGTSLGITTLALALAAPGRRVVSVEGCPALADIARSNLSRHSAGNAEVLNMEFSEALVKLRAAGTKVSMAFIDGNHRGEALKEYVNEVMTMGEEMIIVADDIHLNREMFAAWNILSKPDKTSAALETFRLGILFRSRSLTPGYYRVRY
jgi:predicted O-methyltransferase YrrM